MARTSKDWSQARPNQLQPKATIVDSYNSSVKLQGDHLWDWIRKRYPSFYHELAIRGRKILIGLNWKRVIYDFNYFFIEVSEVYQCLCDGQDGKFPAFHSISGSDPKLAASLSVESTLNGSINLDSAISEMSCSKEPENITKSIKLTDTLLYIYTSGTTG